MVNRIISSSLLYTPKIKNDLQLKTFKVRSEPGGGPDLSYLSLYICQSVHLGYTYSTNIKYTVRFRSTSVWGGFVY